jgi:hypothetical protein
MESLDKLKEMINSFPSPTFNLIKIELNTQIKEVEKEIEDLKSRSIAWSVGDFKSQAQNIEGDDWKSVYDETLFQEALENMIDQHDSVTGINWDVIDVYLEKCKK